MSPFLQVAEPARHGRALRGAEEGARAAGRAEGGRHELRLCRRVQPGQVQRRRERPGTLFRAVVRSHGTEFILHMRTLPDFDIKVEVYRWNALDSRVLSSWLPLASYPPKYKPSIVYI